MGKLTFNLEEYQQAAIKFRADLLKIPMFAIRDTTQHMTVRTGIRGTELVGKESTDAEFAPYKANRKTEVDLNLDLRALTTYFGSLNAEFDPNTAISTLMGHMASQAMEGKLASTPTARDVIAMIAKSAGEHLHDVLWNAVRNPNGTKTKDLFNGFDTITAAEITDGGLNEDDRNLIDLGDEITVDNILDVCELIIDTMHPKLRAQETKLFCPVSFTDMYFRAYQRKHGSLPYNTNFEKRYVEGTNGKVIFVPLVSKDGSEFLHISTKRNMIVGMDQESDKERVNVKDYAPDTLTLMMRIFFGEQFETLDPSQMLVIKHGKKQTSNPPASGGSGNQGSGTTGTDQSGTSESSGDSQQE